MVATCVKCTAFHYGINFYLTSYLLWMQQVLYPILSSEPKISYAQTVPAVIKKQNQTKSIELCLSSEL